jgi:hypothetical protein
MPQHRSSPAVSPGVSITVEGDAIQGQRTAESEANGSYRFLYLPQGEYRVTYQKSKFKTIVYEGAKVEVNKTITMNVTMPRVDVGGNTAGTQSAYRAYGLSGQSITTVDGVNITAGSDGVGAYLDYGAIAEAKISAAGNSAEVPVAGAAVTVVIKSGSNTQHGEFYGDVKPGSSKQYNGAENFVLYRDINAQLAGPFIKDRFWYFRSFRDQYNEFTTGMYDKPAEKGGTPGQRFSTETSGLHPQAELSAEPQKHAGVHDAVGPEISTLSGRFRRRRLSIHDGIDGASG